MRLCVFGVVLGVLGLAGCSGERADAVGIGTSPVEAALPVESEPAGADGVDQPGQVAFVADSATHGAVAALDGHVPVVRGPQDTERHEVENGRAWTAVFNGVAVVDTDPTGQPTSCGYRFVSQPQDGVGELGLQLVLYQSRNDTIFVVARLAERDGNGAGWVPVDHVVQWVRLNDTERVTLSLFNLTRVPDLGESGFSVSGPHTDVLGQVASGGTLLEAEIYDRRDAGTLAIKGRVSVEQPEVALFENCRLRLQSTGH